jgi:hypothetical protein
MLKDKICERNENIKEIEALVERIKRKKGIKDKIRVVRVEDVADGYVYILQFEEQERIRKTLDIINKELKGKDVIKAEGEYRGLEHSLKKNKTCIEFKVGMI